MNATYMYSASQNMFLMNDWKDAYLSAGTWPDDVIEVSDAVFAEFSAQARDKIRIAGVNGMPAWTDMPPPTHDELVARVEQYRSSLLAQADIITADWRTELALDEISDDDRAKLSSWMVYKRRVKAVEAEEAIVTGYQWPDKPE